MSRSTNRIDLHGRKEPVLYTQHSAMMLHNALKYGSDRGDYGTY